MDIDCSIVSLKRSSSAPMINEISATMSITSSTTSSPRDSVSALNIFSNTPRTRRFSTSSPGNAPRLTPRVNQLKQEECIDVAGREAAHEKEIHSAMQISQSWEDLTLEAEGLSFKDSESLLQISQQPNNKINKRIFDPLNLNLPISNGNGNGSSSSSSISNGPPLCSSPSPTRSSLGQRQCYSPGLYMANWKNNLSPSPTRKAFATRRSLSPIAIRPSCLGSVKRKFDVDDNATDLQLQRPLKRSSLYGLGNSPRMESISSPLSGTISSAGTPESLSSVDSPSFSFRPVDSPSPSRGIITNGDDVQTQNSLCPDQLKTSGSNNIITQCNHSSR